MPSPLAATRSPRRSGFAGPEGPDGSRGHHGGPAASITPRGSTAHPSLSLDQLYGKIEEPLRLADLPFGIGRGHVCKGPVIPAAPQRLSLDQRPMILHGVKPLCLLARSEERRVGK